MKQLNVKYVVGAAIIVAFIAAIVLPLTGLDWSAQAHDYIAGEERARLDANNIRDQYTTGCGATFFLKTDGSMELWYTVGESSVLLDSWTDPISGTISYPPTPVSITWTPMGTDADGNIITQININCNGEITAFELEEGPDGGRSLQPVGG